MDAILTPPTRLAETLGTKLRRLAQGADRGNPTANLPWKAPGAYVQGTAYKPGNVVASGGNWYVAANTSTSVGAAGPTHATADPVFDGSGSTGTLWSYCGPAQMATDDAAAPTLSIAASPTLPNLYRPNAHPDRFRVLGASPSAYLTSRWQFDVFQSKAGTTVQGLSTSVEFMIDEGQFEIEQIAATNGIAILVDGRFLSADAIVSAATDQWIKVTIPGGRRTHRIEIRGDRRGWYFGGVRLSATGQVYAPPADDIVRAVFIEDSIGAGSSYGPWLAGRTLHRQIADLLGIRDAWSLSKGGTGYLAKDTDGLSYSYGERLAQVAALKPDIAFFAGSSNDRGTVLGNAATAGDITAAALASFRSLRNLGFAGPIVVFGLVSIDDSAAVSTQKIAYVEQAVADAVTAFGDASCWFVPVRNDPVGAWVTGAWNYGTQTTSANSGAFTNTSGSDKTHPSDLGSAYYAARRAAAFRRNVLTRMR
ncbi:hypothetical protein C3941_24030 [Kaistia algarum]|uniref:SGNH/GDSL hydrolase family protein n=1 Tax=Kaistia algarum TaxID=2083279 RepID=UPI000CE8D102|nr:SGNH/GDSL hydrolase family protein [Kaistia algarum]MCX5514249.1 SGNH/GDSL hydrolase family protein [Kaistia algarum]PPE77364.1 hypothetical protein C3941_24030 [Kaistia algarum]